ncbi:hypothetical protein QL285_035467 [Trifolium repens]|nr:hypothetical protein QL285_035467 [Trifolium repens]
MMEKRVKVLEVTMSELKSALQVVVQQVQQRGLILSELSKQLGLKETSHESEKSNLSGKKAKFVENEISIESLKNSLEQLDRKFPATTTVAPSITKNHTSVVDVIEENHHVIDKNGGDATHNNECETTLNPQLEKIVKMVTNKKEMTKNESHRKEEEEAMFDEAVSVVQRRKEKTIVFEAPPDSDRLAVAPPEPKPPDTGPSWMRFIVTGEEKDLEKPRVKSKIWKRGVILENLGVKRIISELGIFLNPMRQMQKSVPFTWYSNSWLHVSSSGQHKSSFLFHESFNGHSLSAVPVMCHQYTMQCELGQLYQIMGQAQINVSLLMKKIKNCSRVETQELVPFYNNTWIHEKESSVSKIPSLILWGPDHNFLYCSSINWKIFFLGEYELFIQALEINNNWVHGMYMYRPLSFDIPSSLVFEKIIDLFNDYLIKLLGSMQDKEKVFEFQGWSKMIYCLQSDLIPKKKIDLLHELLQRPYLVGVGYGGGNFKTTLLPMYLKVYDHEQELEKYTRVAIIIHYLIQSCLDRYDVSIVAYCQNHFEKTHIMVDVANELDFLLALARNDDIFCRCFRSLRLPKGKEVNVCSWSSLIDRNNMLPTALIEMLMQSWNLEGVKVGFAFGIICIHAFIQWDLGEFKFPMATTTDDYCLDDLLIFHGWFNFVFDRGKFDGFKFSTLRTRLI